MKPRKVRPEAVEILDSDGSRLSVARARLESGVRVVQGSPFLLFLLPLLIPVFVLLMIGALLTALFFGRTAFRVVRWGGRGR